VLHGKYPSLDPRSGTRYMRGSFSSHSNISLITKMEIKIDEKFISGVKYELH